MRLVCHVCWFWHPVYGTCGQCAYCCWLSRRALLKACTQQRIAALADDNDDDDNLRDFFGSYEAYVANLIAKREGDPFYCGNWSKETALNPPAAVEFKGKSISFCRDYRMDGKLDQGDDTYFNHVTEGANTFCLTHQSSGAEVVKAALRCRGEEVYRQLVLAEDEALKAQVRIARHQRHRRPTPILTPRPSQEETAMIQALPVMEIASATLVHLPNAKYGRFKNPQFGEDYVDQPYLADRPIRALLGQLSLLQNPDLAAWLP